jgi:PAS domain S-box-containing protein
MVRVNFAENEITVKIVYYGPGLSGKTTNLQSLHSIASDIVTTKLFSVKTQEDRTLFFDLMPINFTFKNSLIKFKIYTVPGQVHYDSTRKIVLAGADAVVFVADSQKAKLKENIESFENLKLNLMKNKLDMNNMPLALQYNKRDLKDIISVERLNDSLNQNNYKYFTSVAINGEGVLETFEYIVQSTIENVFPKYKITKQAWEVEQILEEIHQTIKPLYASTCKKGFVNSDKSTGLVYQGVDTSKPLPEQLLENAIKATDETASLYSEISILKEQLENKNLQLHSLLKENKYIRQFLESIFNQSGVPVAVCNFTGKIVNWNREMVELTGISAKKAKKMLFSEVLSKRSAVKFYKLLSNLKLNIKPAKAVLEFKTHEGTIFINEVIVSPLTNLDNEVVAYSVFALQNNTAQHKNVTAVEKRCVFLLDSLAGSLLFIKNEIERHSGLSTLSHFVSKTYEMACELKNSIAGDVNQMNQFMEDENENGNMGTFVGNTQNELSELLQHKKILLASDSKILLSNLRKLLTPADITEAIDKSELIRLINVNGFDFIFYDFVFPGLDGKSLHQWLSFEKPYLTGSVIYLVTTGLDEDVTDFFNNNGLNYIVKPVTKQKIQNSLEKVLSGF